MIGVKDIATYLKSKGYEVETIKISRSSHNKIMKRLNETMSANDKFFAVVQGEAVKCYGNGDVDTLIMHKRRFIGIVMRQLKNVKDIEEAVNRFLKMDEESFENCKICLEVRDLAMCTQCSNPICDECRSKLEECPFCRASFGKLKQFVFVLDEHKETFEELLRQRIPFEDIMKKIPVKILDQ